MADGQKGAAKKKRSKVIRPPRATLARIQRINRAAGQKDRELSEAHRELLRSYRSHAASNAALSSGWREPVMAALRFLGGQADRQRESLADYDHERYGPFLGVSDEGSSAAAVRAAASASPKARALGKRSAPLSVGVGFDAERLGGVGEVPVGPEEFADIWAGCIGRLLMTTNIGSRANLRFYLRAPVVTVRQGAMSAVLEVAKRELMAAFKPFVEAVGAPRPLLVFVDLGPAASRTAEERLRILKALKEHSRLSGVTPALHRVGLSVRMEPGPRGRDAALAAIDLAHAAGLSDVAVDGVVRKEADRAISLPGILQYLPEELAAAVLEHAARAHVQVHPINDVDPDTIARDIWSALNSARAMGLQLGKYGLLPLTLEESDRVVEQVQRWFGEWSAAPVFYVDQGLVCRDRIYAGATLTEGVKRWLATMQGHGVRIVLIDTVEKSLGLRIMKMDGDERGLLTPQQIASLDAFGRDRGIRILWAGGITLEHALEFGKLGVFGVYVTTSASRPKPVGRAYQDDPGVASEKEPTQQGIIKVKTAIEAGFLRARLTSVTGRASLKAKALAKDIERAALEDAALPSVLEEGWRAWWSARR